MLGILSEVGQDRVTFFQFLIESLHFPVFDGKMRKME
jgi:hypothetical protein